MKLNLKCALNKYEKIILEYLLDFFFDVQYKLY